MNTEPQSGVESPIFRSRPVCVISSIGTVDDTAISGQSSIHKIPSLGICSPFAISCSNRCQVSSPRIAASASPLALLLLSTALLRTRGDQLWQHQCVELLGCPARTPHIAFRYSPVSNLRNPPDCRSCFSWLSFRSFVTRPGPVERRR